MTVAVFATALALCSTHPAFGSGCSAQLGYPVIPPTSPNQGLTAIVPISATCSAPLGTQLYASASAYDLNSNTAAGAINTILTSVDGGYTFSGQLGFNLPPSIQGHWVQIAVTLFQHQGGGQVSSSSEAFQANAGGGEVVTATVTEQVTYQSPEQFAPSASATPQPGHFIFAYVAIAAILATVIIVTVGLLVYSQRRPTPYPAPRPY